MNEGREGRDQVLQGNKQACERRYASKYSQILERGQQLSRLESADVELLYPGSIQNY